MEAVSLGIRNVPLRRKNAVVAEPVLNHAATFVRQRADSRSMKNSAALWASGELRLHQIPAVELAEELTLMDASLLRKIRPEELKDGAWMNKEKKETLSPNVLAMVKLSNQLAVLVPREILEGSTPSARAKIVSSFVKIASKCYRLRNYNSLKAVLSGLQCTPIYRLKRTWKEVPAKIKKKFDKLTALMSEEHNWKSYRAELQQCIVTSTPCLPFLGVLLTTIVQQESFHFTQSKQQLSRKQSVLEGYTILEAITVRNRLEKLRRLNHSKFSTVTLPSLKSTMKANNRMTVLPITEEGKPERFHNSKSSNSGGESSDYEDNDDGEAIGLSSIGCVVQDYSENRKPEFLKLFDRRSFSSEIREELSDHDTAWSEPAKSVPAFSSRPRYRKKIPSSKVDDQMAFSIIQEAQAVAEGIDFNSSNYRKPDEEKTPLQRLAGTAGPREKLMAQKQKVSLIEMDHVELDILSSGSSDFSLSANSSSSSLDYATSPARLTYRTEPDTSNQHPLFIRSPILPQKRQFSGKARSSDSQVQSDSDEVDSDLCRTLTPIDADLRHTSTSSDSDLHHTSTTAVIADLHHTAHASSPDSPHKTSEMQQQPTNSSIRIRARKKKATLVRKRSNAITEYDINQHSPGPTEGEQPPLQRPLAICLSRSLEGLMDVCLEQNEVESTLTKTTSLQTIDNVSSDDESTSGSQSSLLQQSLRTPAVYKLSVNSSSSSLQSSGSDSVSESNERRPSITYVRTRRRASLVVRVAQIEHPKNPVDLLPKYQLLSLGCCSKADECKAKLKLMIGTCPVNAEAQNYKISYEREPS